MVEIILIIVFFSGAFLYGEKVGKEEQETKIESCKYPGCVESP